MRRPRSWLHWVLVVGAIFAVGQYAALAWLVPRAVMRFVEQAAGGQFSIRRAHLQFPLTTTLASLRLLHDSPQSSLSIQHVTIRPAWLEVPSNTLWLDTLEFERPLLRVTRAADGTFRWPTLRPDSGASSAPSAQPAGTGVPWTIRLGAVSVVDGVLEFVDEQVSPSFHALIDHCSIILGPVTIFVDGPRLAAAPAGQADMSFAVRGRLVGHRGHATPLYCSGWVDPAAGDLQASCQLEPIPLAAFEPYYGGPPELRVYAATLKATSQFSARANRFNGRIQLELNQLAEGDLSVRGRTILDVQKLAGGQTPRLRGEVSLVGSLNDPSGWHAEFLPGDEYLQQLVRRLLDRGVEGLKLTLWGYQLRLSLSPSSRATMTDIEAASREVQEALEILASPPPGEPPAARAAPAAEPTVTTPASEVLSSPPQPASSESQPHAQISSTDQPAPQDPVLPTPPMPASQ